MTFQFLLFRTCIYVSLDQLVKQRWHWQLRSLLLLRKKDCTRVSYLAKLPWSIETVNLRQWGYKLFCHFVSTIAQLFITFLVLIVVFGTKKPSTTLILQTKIGLFYENHLKLARRLAVVYGLSHWFNQCNRLNRCFRFQKKSWFFFQRKNHAFFQPWLKILTINTVQTKDNTELRMSDLVL